MLKLDEKDRLSLASEFDFALEIGADFYSLVRAMYVGKLLCERLYLPKKGEFAEFDATIDKLSTLIGQDNEELVEKLE